ncbi:Signal-transduction histidine kinase senX3 [compost metagenome]
MKALVKTEQKRKLRLISWLMLASEVLLLLFLCKWIVSQYKEESARLDKDIQTVFYTVETKISDSLLNKEVTALLLGNQSADTIEFNVDAPDVQFVPVRPSDRKILHLSRDTTGVPIHISPNSGIAIHSYAVSEDSASVMKNPEDTRKILRFALQQIMNDIELDTFQVKADTSSLRKAFAEALYQQWPNITVNWRSDKNTSNSFSYKPKNTERSLILTGYKLYITKAIIAQTVFCLVLLVLSSLAFVLAYRNTKQQTLFSLQKDHFIDNISHELKTPVATTKVAIEALSMYDALEDPQRSKRYLRMAGWEINRLETMINKIMDTTQATNGVLTLEKEAVNLLALVQEITYSLQQVFIEREIKLIWDLQDNKILWISADRTHLTGAIYNLIDNAIKYGNSIIRISLYQKEHNIYLSIADNGTGIPQAYQSRIFEKFVRVPQGNIHNVKGYGLGLSYAQYVIAAHNGILSLEKDSGWGAVFSISLPESDKDEV